MKKKPTPRATPKDGIAILHKRFVRDDPQMQRLLEEARGELLLAEQLHAMRVSAGLTQQQLAERVGTSRSVISRIEGARYSGHSLAMLRRIAEALGRRVEIRFAKSRLAP